MGVECHLSVRTQIPVPALATLELGIGLPKEAGVPI